MQPRGSYNTLREPEGCYEHTVLLQETSSIPYQRGLRRSSSRFSFGTTKKGWLGGSSCGPVLQVCGLLAVLMVLVGLNSNDDTSADAGFAADGSVSWLRVRLCPGPGEEWVGAAVLPEQACPTSGPSLTLPVRGAIPLPNAADRSSIRVRFLRPMRTSGRATLQVEADGMESVTMPVQFPFVDTAELNATVGQGTSVQQPSARRLLKGGFGSFASHGALHGAGHSFPQFGSRSRSSHVMGIHERPGRLSTGWSFGPRHRVLPIGYPRFRVLHFPVRHHDSTANHSLEDDALVDSQAPWPTALDEVDVASPLGSAHVTLSVTVVDASLVGPGLLEAERTCTSPGGNGELPPAEAAVACHPALLVTLV